MNQWLERNLVCPRDKEKLESNDENLICPQNHIYPIVEGLPIMLVDDVERTHGYITHTLEKIAGDAKPSKNEKDSEAKNTNDVDEFVQSEIPYTSGNLYTPLKNKLISVVR